MADSITPSPKVLQLAQAIAKAEGFGVPEAFPTRVHNPGDLCLGDKGWGTQAGKTVFPDDAAGWDALYHQCGLMLSGQSHVYSLDMTFLQVAQAYTGGDNPSAWAQIVAEACGTNIETTLGEYANG